MAQKKYVSLSKLSTFLDNLKDTFANLTHTHKLSDITDYKVDVSLSSASSNPVANKVIDAEFEAMATAMNALDSAIDGKANTSHTHNISDVTNLQSSLNGKVPTSRTINSKPLSANITLSASDVGAAPSSHSHNDVYYTEAEVDEKIDNALNEAKVNASNKDAVVLAEAQKGINNVQTSIDTHASNTTSHVGSTERTNWNAAHTHSTSTHARVDATKVEDSATNGNIKINGTETNVYSHPNSGVSAGTYKSVTVNAQGHITSGSNPTTLAGYGITDAETKTNILPRPLPEVTLPCSNNSFVCK